MDKSVRAIDFTEPYDPVAAAQRRVSDQRQSQLITNGEHLQARAAGIYAVLEAERLSDQSLVYNVRMIHVMDDIHVMEVVIPCYDEGFARQLWNQAAISSAANLVDATDTPRTQ